jgi:hypothetical protein
LGTILLAVVAVFAFSSCAGPRPGDARTVPDSPDAPAAVGLTGDDPSQGEPTQAGANDSQPNPPETEQDDSQAEPPEAGTNLVPVRYYQFDERWAKARYGTRADDTVRRWGCGPAVMAMAIATLADPGFTPKDAADWAEQHGFFTHAPASGKTEPGFFPAIGAEHGLQVVPLGEGDLRSASAEAADATHERALDAVRSGNWVVALMGKGPWTTESHYVLWYDAPGAEVLVLDSNSKKPAKARNTFELFRQTVIRYWVVTVDQDETRS